VAAGQIGSRDVIVSGHDDGMLRIWNLALRPVASLATHGARVTAVEIGKISGRDVIITGRADGSVQVWDPAAKRTLGNPLGGHLRPVTAVAAGRAGGRDVIVSGSTDRSVRIWDVGTGRLQTLEMLDSVTGLAVSASHLAVASGMAVAVFSVPHSVPDATYA
jgi:WD40 repeat protein